MHRRDSGSQNVSRSAHGAVVLLLTDDDRGGEEDSGAHKVRNAVDMVTVPARLHHASLCGLDVCSSQVDPTSSDMVVEVSQRRVQWSVGLLNVLGVRAFTGARAVSGIDRAK